MAKVFFSMLIGAEMQNVGVMVEADHYAEALPKAISEAFKVAKCDRELEASLLDVLDHEVVEGELEPSPCHAPEPFIGPEEDIPF